MVKPVPGQDEQAHSVLVDESELRDKRPRVLIEEPDALKQGGDKEKDHYQRFGDDSEFFHDDGFFK